MKKLGALLLVLTITGPWAVLLCHCCPAGPAPTSGTVLTSGGCGCCPGVTRIDEKKIGITEGQTWVEPTFLRSALHLTSLAAIFPLSSLEAAKSSLDSAVLGPPRFSNGTPLYLALEVLRL